MRRHEQRRLHQRAVLLLQRSLRHVLLTTGGLRLVLHCHALWGDLRGRMPTTSYQRHGRSGMQRAWDVQLWSLQQRRVSV